ncbi:MAG: nucleotidyl transferase AbiEii/AbiGii toxin family protein [Pseudomonadales bacterium]
MTGLPEKIVAVHVGLVGAGLAHAFGGALALAWCTGRARGTIDIDVNVFVGSERAQAVLAALPATVARPASALDRLARDGQVRVWWERTPVDVFLDSTDYHRQVAERVRWETFMNRSLPFLSCHDLAVFKAFFNRARDWADLEEMLAAGTIEPAAVAAVLIRYLGADDERVQKLMALEPPSAAP